jgi:predicted phosphohydrolase
MKIGFDVISDLNLIPDEEFNWEGKATSLYCIIAGNISNDLRTIHQTLNYLSKFYQGIFYTAGALEYEGAPSIPIRTEEIVKICKTIRNIAYLHNHVVVIDGVAIIGTNGWYATNFPNILVSPEEIEIERYEDLGYLGNTIEKLQLHLDVKKVIIVSHSVPGQDLFFKEYPQSIHEIPSLQLALVKDSESKIHYWIFGTYGKTVDIVINGINYVNNSYYKRNPYWAKRIEI